MPLSLQAIGVTGSLGLGVPSYAPPNLNAAGSSDSSSQVVIVATLSGVGTSDSEAMATLVATLSGTGVSTSVGVSTLATTIPLVGEGDSGSVGAASLLILAGLGISSSTAGGTLTVARALNAQGASASQAVGLLALSTSSRSGLVPNIVITEDWERINWNNFTAYTPSTTSTDLGQSINPPSFPFAISTQNHIDIRTFNEPQGWSGTGITTGSIASLNHWPGATITLGSGTSTFTSNYTTPIDLTTLGISAILGLAIPNSSLGQINLSASYLELSSDGFNQAICALPWSSATITTTAGNNALTWTFGQLGGVDLSRVTGVRLVITATGSTTLKVMDLRLFDPNWVLTDTTFDSLNGQLRQAIPTDGRTNATIPNNQKMPILWRADYPSSINDPQPIDITMGFYFYTGSQTGANSFSLYARENAPSRNWITFEIQWGNPNTVNLIGVNGATTQETIVLSNHQPYWALCTLSDHTAQLQIYNVDPASLNPTSVAYDTTAITDQVGFPRRRGRIGFHASLTDGDAYVGAWRPQNIMFATYTSVPFQSRTPVKGAHLHTRYASDIELWSDWSSYSTGPVEPLVQTNTQRTLSGQSTEIQILNNDLNFPGPTQEPSLLLYPGGASQGIISNVLTPSDDPVSGITDLARLVISFDLWVPGQHQPHALVGGVAAALVGTLGDPIIALPIPLTSPNQWQHVKLRVPPQDPPLPSGLFQLVVYSFGTPGFVWWIDNVSVTQPSIDWQARSSGDAHWTSFHGLVNSDTNGVRLNPQGKALQVQALALRQDSYILDHITIIPEYAELGNLLVETIGSGLYPGEEAPSPSLLPNQNLFQ